MLPLPITILTASQPSKLVFQEDQWRDGVFFHLSNNQSSTRTSTAFRHRIKSSNKIKIHCQTWLPKSANELKSFKVAWQKAKIETDFRTHILELHTLVKSGRDWYKAGGESWLHSWTVEALPTKYWAQHCDDPENFIVSHLIISC